MAGVAIVVDSIAVVPPDAAEELGIRIAPVGVSFADQAYLDTELAPAELYRRLRENPDDVPPPAGVDTRHFQQLFSAAFDAGAEGLLCLLHPFETNPSHLTAHTALAELEPHPPAKLVNTGLGGPGGGALAVVLARGAAEGRSLDDLADAVDALAPHVEMLLAPSSTQQLARSGRLAAIESRLGKMEKRLPIVRIVTRVASMGLADDEPDAAARMVQSAAERAEGRPVVVVVAHAGAPERAAHLCDEARAALNVDVLYETHLAALQTSILGVGAVGLGACPVLESTG